MTPSAERRLAGDATLPQVRLLHVAPSLDLAGGGTSRAVVGLADALAAIPGFDVSLLTQGSRSARSAPSNSPLVDRHDVSSLSKAALRLGLPLRRALVNTIASRRPGLIHSHGIWLPVNHWTTGLARRHAIPSVIQPHGMLEPWALEYKPLRKRLVMSLYQRHDLESADALLATSNDEYENIRAAGLVQPIAVIPNGIEMPTVTPLPSTRNEREPRKLLFLSRIHPKKGLLNLVDAWAKVNSTGWVLQIAGPDEGGHQSEVLRRADKLGIRSSIQVLGELDGAAKSCAYANADLFVLPTFSENFGIVVAEALAHGVPVITTHGAPWSDLQVNRCGWWIEVGVDPLSKALEAAMTLADEDRAQMGARGKEYVRQYAWTDIARKTASLYHWLLGHSEKPPHVHLS